MIKHVIIIILISSNLLGQTTSPLINGVFTAVQSKYYTNAANCNANVLKTENSVAAYFSATSMQNINPTNFCKAGNVKFNNEKLEYNESKFFYSKTELQNFNQFNWKVSGNAGIIPNLNFNYNGTLPNFTIAKTLFSDTLKKADTLFLHISNIINADSIMVTINDNNQLPTKHYVAFIAPNYTNNYYLPPTIFAPLNVGLNAVIKLDAINYTYQTIAGKQYLFRNIYSFVKTNVLIIN